MSQIEHSTEVDVPVQTAYDQWTQFEEFPRFMEGVDQVTQVTDTRTHWVTSIGGVKREFDAEITEQTPDQRIAWQAVDGPKQTGAVTFQPLGPDRTKVMLLMEVEPEGPAENVGEKAGVLDARVNGDLKRFKKFIESRGSETGAWRGEVG